MLCIYEIFVFFATLFLILCFQIYLLVHGEIDGKTLSSEILDDLVFSTSMFIVFCWSFWFFSIREYSKYKKDKYSTEVNKYTTDIAKISKVENDKSLLINFHIQNENDNNMQSKINNICRTSLIYIYNFFKLDDIYCEKARIANGIILSKLKNKVDKKNIVISNFIVSENEYDKKKQLNRRLLNFFSLTMQFIIIVTLIIFKIMQNNSNELYYFDDIMTYGTLSIECLYSITSIILNELNIRNFKKKKLNNLKIFFNNNAKLEYNKRFSYYEILKKDCDIKLIIRINIVQQLQKEEIDSIINSFRMVTKFDRYKINENTLSMPNNDDKLQIEIKFEGGNLKHLKKVEKEFDEIY